MLITKIFTLLFVLFSAVAPVASAGTVQLSDVSIEVHQMTDKKYSFMFCEMGLCSPFGKAEGYELKSFENMNKSCQVKSRSNQIVSSVLEGLSFVALAYFSAGAGSIVFVTGQMTASGIRNSDNKKASRMANDLLPSLIKNNGQFEFLFDDFVLLKEGLEFCHDYYEKTPTVWLRDCNRNLKCKENLAKELHLPKSAILKYSAQDIYQLKAEQEFLERQRNLSPTY